MKISRSDDSTGHVLLSYTVTKDLWTQFDRTQAVQKKLFDLESYYDRIVVTDNAWPYRGFMHLPADDLYERGYFNLSRARNRVLEYAQQHNYDWVFLLDADSVVYDFLEVPERGFTQCLCYFSTSEDAESGTFRTDSELNWRGSGWFILPRAAFSLRFCEQFVGYYGEDLDYFHNVLVPAGIQPSKWCSRVIHLWHPMRHCTPEQSTTNKRLLARRLAQLHNREFLEGIKQWSDGQLIEMVEEEYRCRNPFHAAKVFLNRAWRSWRETGKQRINQ